MTKQYRAFCTRQDLIRSAAEVIGRTGFAEASLTTISARAGVSTGGLTFHFRNKQALGEAVELAAAESLLRVTGHVQLRHPAPLQLLVDTSHALARSLAEDPVLRAGFGLGRDATWQSCVALWGQWQDWVELMLNVARDRGDLAPDVAPKDVVSPITAVLAGFEVLRGGSDGDAGQGLRDELSRFWRLFMPRIAAEPVRNLIDPDSTHLPLSAGTAALGGAGDYPEICGVA
ncbi:TetR/AcrR family transcriptional regulator [Streptomyces sp. LP05-1]|uniref:TetR/AcrR family transcriptional regulator n=1 Tax=Streptomyces pyxinae TaxID=2970734 RepID=A0ABT2CLS3_9ACTN|nr:ScbR family autoregulator-binding transcription factor [Streptomyces sp. LP05-1]MCS0638383.1 TetR/AcrR family transcriptional regulator [Streptomyces sp. LP05-1]